MAVGQVGFKDNKKVKRLHVEQRLNPIVNRLNKTKVEKYPDLRQEKQDREKELRKKDTAARQARVSCDRPATRASLTRGTAQGRSSSRKGEKRACLPKRPHVRRHIFRRRTAGFQQPGSRRRLSRRLYVMADALSLALDHLSALGVSPVFLHCLLFDYLPPLVRRLIEVCEITASI